MNVLQQDDVIKRAPVEHYTVENDVEIVIEIRSSYFYTDAKRRI